MRLLHGAIPVYAAFEHSGPAVPLVHSLKYGGETQFAAVVASVLAGKCAPLPLVPVPRSWSRWLAFGVDASIEIARRVSEQWGQPVLPAIRRPLHSRRRAGTDHRAPPHQFRSRVLVDERVYLVDDVVTTGATAIEAAHAIGFDRVEGVLASNLVSGVSRLSRP